MIEKDNEENIPLKSAVGVEYTKLRDLLAAHKWREADEETYQVMLKAAGRQKEGWLRMNDIDNFPMEDLYTTNKLWVFYSKGHFGFSIQKRIYQDKRGTTEYNLEVRQRIGHMVGWRVDGNWINYDDFNFSLKAEKEHLPGKRKIKGEDWVMKRLKVWYFF